MREGSWGARERGDIGWNNMRRRGKEEEMEDEVCNETKKNVRHQDRKKEG